MPTRETIPLTNDEYVQWYSGAFGVPPPDLELFDDESGHKSLRPASSQVAPTFISFLSPKGIGKDMKPHDADESESSKNSYGSPDGDLVYTELLKLWLGRYRKTFDAVYRDGLPRPARLQQLTRLLELCDGSEDRARKAIKAMFSPDLHWVTDISLRWLSKESNFTRFVVPVLQDKRSATTDWKSKRSVKNCVKIRRRRI